LQFPRSGMRFGLDMASGVITAAFSTKNIGKWLYFSLSQKTRAHGYAESPFRGAWNRSTKRCQEPFIDVREGLEAIVSQTATLASLLCEIYNRIERCNKTTAEKSEKWREDFTEFIEQSYKITALKPADL
jgi:hypothetical protein